MARRPRTDPGQWSALTSLVGDVVRLRIIRLLEREELGVGELARVLQLPQSTVSRHLKVLLDAGWTHRRHQGTAGLYRVDPAQLDETARRVWEIARDQVSAAHMAADEARLAGVLAERRIDSRDFFGRLGGDWDVLRRELFGTQFPSQALLSLLDPRWVVADLGCGTGDVAEQIAPLVKRVIAVDREPAMLDAARRRLSGARNVDFRRADLQSLPIGDGQIDAAVLMLVLHHVDAPADVLRECGRTLRAGGRLLVVDMVRHDREEYARTMGHRHLGFEERDGRAWARTSGLSLERWQTLRASTEARGPALFAALFLAEGDRSKK
ncbi:MAG: ArsR family transcriptional regulator [Phycisphaeraceae bacterium]|nr:ArsR family transcriptional regulator [Phycisphaeraceae bacterium]